MTKTANDEEILIADIQRSLSSITEAWETDFSINADTMCGHLEQVISLIQGDISFNEFKDATGLNDKNDS